MSTEGDIAQAIAALAVPAVVDAIRAWANGKPDVSNPVHAEVVRILGPLGALRDDVEALRRRLEAIEGLVIP